MLPTTSTYDVIIDLSGSSCTSINAVAANSSLSNSACSSTSSAGSGNSVASATLSSSSTTSSSSGTLKWQRQKCDYCCWHIVRHQYATSSAFRAVAWLLAASLFCSVYWFGSSYMKSMLLWIETQNGWLTFGVFLVGFAIVSFPVVVGYLILIITSGYLFGCVKGVATVVIGANVGAAIAHHTIRSWHTRFPVQRLLKNDTGKAILRVISGPRAFKVVLLARLTPIPFGLQNTIFGISNVQRRSYYLATMIGLFPAQLINVYIGSSLRSMHDVLNNHSTALTSYAVFAVQICIGIVLMAWVIQKARRELAEALLQEIDSDYKEHVQV